MMLKITKEDAKGLFKIKQDLIRYGTSGECPFDHRMSTPCRENSEKNRLVCRNKCKILFPTLIPLDCPCGIFSMKHKLRVINKCLKGNGYGIKTGKKVI